MLTEKNEARRRRGGAGSDELQGVATRQMDLRPRLLHGLAVALGALATLMVLAAIVLSVQLGWSWAKALDSFVVSNAVLGFSFAICGSILARHRPGNPIGWLFAVGGLAETISAAAAPLGHRLQDLGAPLPALRLVETVFAWSWPLAIGFCLPLALLLFPDGRPPSPRWRPVVIAVIVTAPLFSLEMGTSPAADPGFPPAYLTLPFYFALQPLWTATEVRGLLALLLGLAALVVRYRRGTEVERRQLLWLLLGVMIMLVAVVPWGLVAGTPIFVLFSIALVPVAVAVAIIRERLLDIRLVVSRALAWLLLSLAVLVVYVGAVAVLERLVSAQLGRSALVTIVLVLMAAPLLPRLQRLVDRAIYGDRSNAATLVSTVGTQLAVADTNLAGVVASVRAAMRLPYVALERDGKVLASDGTRPERIERWPLAYSGREVGTLEVGLRTGERSLSSPDRKAMPALAAPMAVAVEASAMAAELLQSRERILGAQAEERRRLRRQLHDGLGPTLTGIAFTADAAANLLESDPVQSSELLTALRRDSRVALADVKRIVDDLRPAALDELGLVGALRRRAEQLVWRADGEAVQIRLDVPAEVPTLPPAVEVATYRIATEALTNIVRHSGATTALLRLECGERLEVSVIDDGPAGLPWALGVGLTAMRERAVELGGSFSAGPSTSGGQVRVSFPLEVGV